MTTTHTRCSSTSSYAVLVDENMQFCNDKNWFQLFLLNHKPVFLCTMSTQQNENVRDRGEDGESAPQYKRAKRRIEDDPYRTLVERAALKLYRLAHEKRTMNSRFV